MPRLFLLVLLVLPLLALASPPDYQTPAGKNLPRLVREDMAQNHPGAVIESVSWHLENGDTVYVIALQDNWMTGTVIYASDGTPLETDEPIEFYELPSAVADSLAAHYPDYEEVKAGKVTDELAHRITYEVAIKVDDQLQELVISEKGVISGGAEKTAGEGESETPENGGE